MALDDLLTRAVSPFTGLAASPTILHSWQRSRSTGLERDDPPPFHRVDDGDLERRQGANRDLLEIAIPHLDWLSRWFQQRPHVVYLVDRDGIVLHAQGDPEAISRYGLSPGFDWSESRMGTNGAGTALATAAPVAVIGCDHWSTQWKDATCLGAPILGRDGGPVGAIDISMDVREGDAERLVVAAHVAHTISEELARLEAERDGLAKDALYQTVRALLESERSARAQAEAALERLEAAEAALRESESRLSLALDKAEMGMWELDLQTNECTWSSQVAALFGLPRDREAITLAELVELVDEEHREAVLQAQQAAVEGAPLDVEFSRTWPDGTVHWVNWKGRLATTLDGSGRRLIGIGQDVTRRRESESALRRSEHLLRTVIDSTPALVYVVDEDGRFLLVNRKFTAIHGLPEGDDFVGRTLHDFFPPDLAAQLAANNRRVIEGGTSCEFEEVVPDRDGRPRTYVTVKAPLTDAPGGLRAICGVSTDITEQKRLMSALEASQRQKDTAIATLAHELRQPLNAMQAALAVMRTRLDREKGERARAIVERQVKQLARLVEDVLDASHIARGTVTLRRDRTTLNGILETAVAIVLPLVRERGQHLEVVAPQPPVWLDADALRLQQVFSNLLTNASKFTGAGGRITVTVEPAGDAVTVRVSDTGRGIAADVLPHIFDLFAQAAPDSRGLGIGLALVRGLVQGHGGRIHAHSDGPGRGSEFVVSLPVASETV